MSEHLRVHLYTVCWDEADMLGFFFRHYDPWIDRYVIYDDRSTDGSLDILRNHPKVDLHRLDRANADSFCLSHKAMQDEAWKSSRGRADWVVLTAIDEHLHVRGRSMSDYLRDQSRAGVTLVPAVGFDMNNPTMPDDKGLLVERVVRGRARIAFNKLSIFQPDAVVETKFAPGRHAAEPIGDLRLPSFDEVMLWHFKHLDFERNAAREDAQALRLGSADIAGGMGRHYLRSKDERRSFWDEMEAESLDLSQPGFEPRSACAQPLWWNERTNIERPGRAVARPARVDKIPTVSVLVKAFNHEAYIGQTLRSILDQSFTDFEIIVTDDGSTDRTADIVRAFSDSRIRLEILPENTGISSAMNATIARSRGRYLAILNSDDWALPGRIARQVTFLDANPRIGVLFGLPQVVNERGASTTPFNDFRAPFAFPEMSRRNWLRHVFFRGNCLCAPTAMVRRTVYDAVGPYDPRLTNLQDLDMWVRMLIAGVDFHLLDEDLTAFRVRDHHGNMSAPRVDTELRSAFEFGHVFGRLAELDASHFKAIFDEDGSDGVTTESVAMRLAELALRVPRPEYLHFALQCVHKGARSNEDRRKLFELAGTLDPFNIVGIRTRDATIDNLRSSTIGRASMPASFAEARAVVDVTRTYRLVLRRLPEPGALHHHVNRILKDRMTLEDIARAFLGSSEFATFRGQAAPAEMLTEAALGRAADQAELAIPPERLLASYLRRPDVIARTPVIDAAFPEGLPLDQRHLYTLWSEERRFAVEPDDLQPPPISIVVVATNIPEGSLASSLASLASSDAQIVIACIGAGAKAIALALANLDSRDGAEAIEMVEAVSMTSALSRAMGLCRRTFVGLIGLGDELCPGGLSRVRLFETKADLVIGDEDAIYVDGLRGSPALNGRFDPDLLLQQPLSALVLFRRDRLAGAWSDADRVDLLQWDMLLRVARSCPAERIASSGLSLVHRARPPDRADERWTRAMSEIGQREVDARFPGSDRPTIHLQGDILRLCHPIAASPTVSIIIPTRDRGDLLAVCVDSILERTRDVAFEIVIVDNRSLLHETADLVTQFVRDPRCRAMTFDEDFNWSRLNNYAIRHCMSDVVVVLNNDTRVIEEGWLRELVSQALRPEVGIVGAKLSYEDNGLQHAGLECAGVGTAVHLWRHASRWDPGYQNQLCTVRNVSAVTGACMAFRRKVWERLGGFDEGLAVTWNDVDFCLRAHAAGHRVLWTPYADLVHQEQATRGHDLSAQAVTRFERERALFTSNWQHLLPALAFQSPHLRADLPRPVLRTRGPVGLEKIDRLIGSVNPRPGTIS